MGLEICRLKTRIQRYHWGSRTFLSEMRGEPRPSDEPEAELWIGVHPQAPSQVDVDGHGNRIGQFADELPAPAVVGPVTAWV